jgi:hypothetical protein
MKLGRLITICAIAASVILASKHIDGLALTVIMVLAFFSTCAVAFEDAGAITPLKALVTSVLWVSCGVASYLIDPELSSIGLLTNVAFYTIGVGTMLAFTTPPAQPT